MSLINFTGFEDNSPLGEQATCSGTYSFQTSVVRSGTYAFRTNPISSASGYYEMFGNASTGRRTSFTYSAYLGYSFDFRYDTKPSTANEPIFCFFMGFTQYYISLNSAGKLDIYKFSVGFPGTYALVSSGTTVLSASTWYRLSGKFKPNTSGELTLLIDGVSELSITGNYTGTVTTVRVGKSVNRNTNTVDFFFDNLVVLADELPSSDRYVVSTAHPNANGSTMQWNAGTGASDYTQVDETTYSNADYVKTDGTSAQTALFAFPSSSSIGMAYKYIFGVKANVTRARVQANTFPTSANKVVIKSGSSYDRSGAQGINVPVTDDPYYWISENNPASGIPWTSTDIDTVELGSDQTNSTSGEILLNYVSMSILHKAYATPVISHTVDSLLRAKQTIALTHSSDSLLRSSLPRSHTSDALLRAKQTITSTHTVDSLLKVSNTLSHTSDALLKNAVTISYSVDSMLHKEITCSSTVDSLLRSSAVKSHSVDSLLRKSYSPTSTSDALLRKSFTVSSLSDALLRKNYTKTHTVDAYTHRTLTISHSVDSLLFSPAVPYTRSHTADSYLRSVRTGNVIGLLIALTYNVKLVGAITNTVDALLKKQSAKSNSVDSMLRRVGNPSSTVDSLLRSSKLLTHSIDALKRSENIRNSTVDALLKRTGTPSHTIDASLRPTLTIPISNTVNALLRDILVTSVSTSIDSYLRGVGSAQLSVDSLLRKSYVISGTVDTLLHKTFVVTHTIDASLRFGGIEIPEIDIDLPVILPDIILPSLNPDTDIPLTLSDVDVATAYADYVQDVARAVIDAVKPQIASVELTDVTIDIQVVSTNAGMDATGISAEVGSAKPEVSDACEDMPDSL